MATHRTEIAVRGPWSLQTSRRFWEGFPPAALAEQPVARELRTVFRCETDWQRVETAVSQSEGQHDRGDGGRDGAQARVVVRGEGDLDAATAQVARFLALDVDGRGWPEVGRRDPVMGELQAALPGFRPCGFHSPYEAAAWAVLAQRLRIVQAVRLRAELTGQLGEAGAFPAPAVLRSAELDLPGRKADYLRAVAEAALEGRLDGSFLRSCAVEEAVATVRQVKGLGPFAAELVVLRGANAPDGVPRAEKRLAAEVAARYGTGRDVSEVAEAWRPYRTWAAVHLRAVAGQR